MINFVVTLALLSTGLNTAEKAPKTYKGDLIDAVSAACFPTSPKEFCVCMLDMIDKQFTEADLKKVAESNDESLNTAMIITLKLFNIECARQYHEMKKDKKKK